MVNSIAEMTIFLYNNDHNKTERGKEMVVTATDLKTNLGKYLSQIGQEDIIISKNGKPIARLAKYKERVSDSLVGFLSDDDLPADFDGDYRKLIREGRVSDYENLD